MLLTSVSFGLLKALAVLLLCQVAVLGIVYSYRKYVRTHKHSKQSAKKPRRLAKLLAPHNV